MYTEIKGSIYTINVGKKTMRLLYAIFKRDIRSYRGIVCANIKGGYQVKKLWTLTENS